MCSVMSRTFTPVSEPCLLGSAMMPPCRERVVDEPSIRAVYRTLLGRCAARAAVVSLGRPRATALSLSMCPLADQGRMSDETLVRFTAHELRREDLHALMVRSNGPALVRALWHGGVLVLPGNAPLELPRHAVGRSPSARPRLRPGFSVLRVSRGGAPHRVPQPLAQRARGLGGGLPHCLAVSQLSRVPLGASPLHAGHRARSRALLPQAGVPRRLPVRAHRRPELPATRGGHSPPRFRTGRPPLDAAHRAPPPDPRSADLSRALRTARSDLRARAVAGALARLDSPVAG